ncbi:MAG: DinB family protein, partial [Acidobacteria bacterium]|nr:DinB family protein [Acidobacteriota bacterium]
MELTGIIELLERNGMAITTLLERMDRSVAGWKPSPDKWSALEIASHLLDEERDDFRRRIRLTLEDPQQEWPPIDPEGWVTEHSYAARNLDEVVTALRDERHSSIEWLRSVDLDLEASHLHPQLGPMRIGDLLAAWAAHDLLHLRQLTRIQFQWLERELMRSSRTYFDTDGKKRSNAKGTDRLIVVISHHTIDTTT